MKKTETKLRGLYKQLHGLGAMLPGTLESRGNVCGKAGCRCKDKVSPVKHGPYHRLCVGKKGITGTFFVAKGDADAIEDMCAEFQRAKELLSDIAVATMELWRAEGICKVTEVIQGLVVADISPPPSFAPIRRKLEGSRNQWKAKAEARRAELETARITKRDLIGSRDKWRTEALDLRKNRATAAKQLSSVEHELAAAKKKA